MTKHSGAWDRLKWEVQTICAWKRKTQERRSQRPSDCWPQLSVPWGTNLIWMGETEGRGTPGSGRVYPGGLHWERLACGSRSGRTHLVRCGGDTMGKKKETNSSRVLCCDETSIVLEVIMPQFTLSLCNCGGSASQVIFLINVCMSQAGAGNVDGESFHYRSSKMDIVEVTWAKKGQNHQKEMNLLAGTLYSFPPVKRFHLKGLALHLNIISIIRRVLWLREFNGLKNQNDNSRDCPVLNYWGY